MEHRALAHFKRALDKFHRGEVKDGLVDLEQAIQLDPARWEFFWTRGAFNYRRRAYPAALSDLTQAIDLCSDVEQAAKIYQRRMFCYGRLEDYERVVKDATWLIEHGFIEPNIYQWRGWSKYIMGNLEGAIEDYSRVLELTLDPYGNRLNRVMLYYKSHRYDEALEDLDQALKFALRELETERTLAFVVYQCRALVLYQRGDIEKSFYEYNYGQVLVGFKPYVSMESYVATIKDLVHSFSGIPSRPSDRAFLTRRGTPQESII